VIASKTTTTQLVEDLLATFCDPDACVAELLCDRHPADAVAFTIVERPAGRRLERKAQCIPERLFSSTGMNEKEAADLRDAVRHLIDALNASLRKETA